MPLRYLLRVNHSVVIQINRLFIISSVASALKTTCKAMGNKRLSKLLLYKASLRNYLFGTQQQLECFMGLPLENQIYLRIGDKTEHRARKSSKSNSIKQHWHLVFKSIFIYLETHCSWASVFPPKWHIQDGPCHPWAVDDVINICMVNQHGCRWDRKVFCLFVAFGDVLHDAEIPRGQDFDLTLLFSKMWLCLNAGCNLHK